MQPEERQHMTALLTQKLNERDVSFRAGAGNRSIFNLTPLVSCFSMLISVSFVFRKV
jgi:hypothetical protein